MEGKVFSFWLCFLDLFEFEMWGATHAFTTILHSALCLHNLDRDAFMLSMTVCLYRKNFYIESPY